MPVPQATYLKLHTLELLPCLARVSLPAAVGTDSQWYRYLLLSSFLRLCCQRARGILLLDLKDVLLQLPPWPLLAPGRVTAFEEISELRHKTWNACAAKHAHTSALSASEICD